MHNFKDQVHSVQLDGITYYVLYEVEGLLSQNLINVIRIDLPVLINGIRKLVPCATFEDIQSAYVRPELSEFDKKLKQALEFNPKEKPPMTQ